MSRRVGTPSRLLVTDQARDRDPLQFQASSSDLRHGLDTEAHAPHTRAGASDGANHGTGPISVLKSRQRSERTGGSTETLCSVQRDVLPIESLAAHGRHTSSTHWIVARRTERRCITRIEHGQ
ncbi:hypothetical protein C9J85_01080 [Haloferax sp. wsp5]|nr:hypothetical protein C9J85_01080 [Haloferax sp. wsp5]